MCGYTSGVGIKHWGIGALAAALVSVTAAFSASGTAEPVPAPAPVVTVGPELAGKLVHDTPHGAAPDRLISTWESCGLAISIDYAVSAGMDAGSVRQELAYPVAYLQELGYYVAIGNEVPYAENMPAPATPGTVLVVAANNTAEQPSLFSAPDTIGHAQVNAYTATSAIIGVNGRGMNAEVLLHEMGHVLGLGHKDGTVMTAKGTGTPGFDAAETAAIDCR